MKHTRTHTLLLLVLLLFVSSASAQSLRTLLQTQSNIIESKWEENSQGDREMNYYNEDFCDYYLYRINDRSYNLRPGKNTVFKILKGSKADNPFKTPSSYHRYRGRFPVNFQIDTPYALPIKNGRKIEWQTDRRESLKTMNFQMEPGDTVYATRSGTACKTSHPQQLLIYHLDNTFAAYLTMSENFIRPGEEIQVGQPVGIVAGSMGVSVSYFFLDPNKFENNTTAVGYVYSHFTPLFRTSEGDVKMEEKRTYQCVIDDALIVQDMSKREQKKYLKKK